MSRVETRQGVVEGQPRGGHVAFRGIPYARPPRGELRFCAPQPPLAWHGVRAAFEFGPSAIQGPAVIAGQGGDGAQSEDCLYLNIYSPTPDGARRPVMVWIHGGAFVFGGSNSPLYDGGPLCERGDVVVVTFNYRVGALGFLSLADQGGRAFGATPNAGLLDQAAALRWVRDNIARFGGDPDNVTIFGESAGSFSCSAQLALPAARGLFHRAICQSGAAYRLASAKSGDEAAQRFLARAGLPPGQAQALRDLPVEKLLEVQLKTPQAMHERAFFPICEGQVLPMQVEDALARGTAAAVPLLIGTNRDEMNLFNMAQLKRRDEPMSDEQLVTVLSRELGQSVSPHLDRLIEAYRVARARRSLPTGNRYLIDALETDRRFRIPSVRLAEAKSRTQPPVYAYLFTQRSPAKRGNLGACHALEIPFVFGTLDAPYQDRFAGTGPQVEALSARMMDAWIAFARAGDPNCKALPAWPRYDVERRATLLLGPECVVEDDPFGDERAAWDGAI